MYFTEFMILAEGKKKEQKRALKRMFDSGHRDMTGNVPGDDPEYKKRRKSAIKSIMKGLKESPDNERDRLRSKRAEEERREKEDKASRLKAKQKDDSRFGRVGVRLPNTGRLHHSSKKHDKYTVDTSYPKNKEYRF